MKHEYAVKSDNFVVLNHSSVLQSITAFATFNIPPRQHCDVNTKSIYTLCVLLLYGLNATNSMQEPVDAEQEESYTTVSKSSCKAFVSHFVFTFFVVYGFVYPLYTRLGCCGKWKTKQDDYQLSTINVPSSHVKSNFHSTFSVFVSLKCSSNACLISV